MTTERKADFFVATNGNDGWSGRVGEPDAKGTDGPFASISRAQQAVREAKAALGDKPRPIVVQLRGGTYWLDAPLRFAPEDSGSEGAPVIYMAYPGEKPIISGGRPITGWTKTDQGWWKTQLDEVKKGDWHFIQLFVNGQRRFRPRLPKEGYYFIEEELPPTEGNKEKGFDRLKFSRDAAIRDDWCNLDHVEVLCFHIWCMSRIPLGSVDAKERVITLAAPTCYPEYWAALFKGNRFLVENVREALGEPGQWYLDRRSGELTYIPMDGEDIETTEVIAPRVEQLLLFDGDVEKEALVWYIHFEGLVFSHSNWVTPPAGQSAPQADVDLNAAISAEGARYCSLIGCDVTHIGQYAIQWGRGCRHNLVESCRITDIGAGGVKLGRSYEADIGYDEKTKVAISGYNAVRDCLICQLGRVQPAAIGIWIGHSPYNRIEHNEIYDLYYSTLSCGWVWGYAPSQAHNNVIAYNHFHDIGQHVLSDMGGTYMLGVSPGTVIHCNLMHDVNAFDYGGWGLYFDQGGSDIIASHNICYRCNGQGIHHHFGRGNYVVNNILAFGGKSQIERGKDEAHVSYRFERNIVYWKDEAPFLSNNLTVCEPIAKGIRLDYNIYYNADGHPIRFRHDTLQQWQDRTGNDRHSFIADPMFVDPDNGDFTLKPGSPAGKIGFQPIDTTSMGQLTEKTRPADVAPAFPTGVTADSVRHLMEKKFDGMES